MKNTLYIVIFLISFIGMAQETNTLTVEFQGIENKKGKLFVALYNSEASFLKKEFQGTIVEIKNGTATAVFSELPHGTYAASCFHDANGNGKMDTNFFGIPKEDYATSNDAKGFMGPPKFNDAKFEVKGDQTITLNF